MSSTKSSLPYLELKPNLLSRREFFFLFLLLSLSLNGVNDFQGQYIIFMSDIRSHHGMPLVNSNLIEQDSVKFNYSHIYVHNKILNIYPGFEFLLN